MVNIMQYTSGETCRQKIIYNFIQLSNYHYTFYYYDDKNIIIITHYYHIYIYF